MPGAAWRGNRELLLFNGDRVSVGDGENVLEMEDGNGYRTIGVSLMPLNCTHKWLKKVNFMLCFTSIKKELGKKKKKKSTGFGTTMPRIISRSATY